MKKFKKKKVKGKYKYCPVCGTQLEIDDTYCTTCGYSFEARHKKHKKGIKWKNILIVIALLIIAYIIFRILSNQPILPSNLQDLFNFTKQ